MAMQNHTPKTCQVEMYSGEPCGRPLHDGDKCICHSEKEDKDVKLFQQELDKIFADEETEYYDLTRFVFPKVGYTLPTEYKKDTFFTGAKFSGDAYLHSATFSGEASFGEATFSGKASFIEAKFSGEASFAGAKFSGETWFAATQFEKDVSFAFCRASKAAQVIFDGEELQRMNKEIFSVEADFAWCSFAEPKNIIFRKLSLERCDFLNTDVTEVQFVDVTWARKPKFLKWFPRNAVHDEFAEQPDYNLIAQLYRRLQQNYINICWDRIR